MLLQCVLAELPDGVGGDINSLSGNIQEAAVQVELDHFVTRSELGYLVIVMLMGLFLQRMLDMKVTGSSLPSLTLKCSILVLIQLGDQ